MELEGAACIVTGASSGIGAATSRLLSGHGAKLVLAARRAERLEALAADLPGSLPVVTDVTDPEQVVRLVTRCVEAFGKVDVLVNNAGQGLHVPVEELDPVDMRAVLELNVIAPLVGLQAVLPYMREQSAGAIVNVSSATSLRVFAGLGGYSATKAALNLLSQVGPAGVGRIRRDGVGRLPIGDRHRVSRSSPRRPPCARRAERPAGSAGACGRSHRLRNRNRRGPRARLGSTAADHTRRRRRLERVAGPSGPWTLPNPALAAAREAVGLKMPDSRPSIRTGSYLSRRRGS